MTNNSCKCYETKDEIVSINNCETGLANCINKSQNCCPKKNDISVPIENIFRRRLFFRKHRLRKIFKKTVNISESVILGMGEGLASGALTGTNVSGAGGWGFGLIGQAFGALCGGIAGSFSGALVGLVTEKKTLMCIFENYRKHFGVSHHQNLKR